MQFKTTLLSALFFGSSQTLATAIEARQNCGNSEHAIAFYRAYSSSATDHFYTTSATEIKNAYSNLGYTYEGVAGHIFPSQERGTIPLYRLYGSSATDHFYTISASEKDNAALVGYTNEGIAGFVYPDSTCGGQALYRLYSGGATDHFYTMSSTEANNANQHLGYAREGNVGFIFP
ncbi:hypothetical protein BDQ12DRAFT_743178 [Crucibulum laeve]|uniref:DUF5648 domain-containing protein n=1 Tax=Crucibulum laeve TaxID=68775 RepID=A0A5C3MLK0_9AGAR|nr:hypothetical protein BDQ12DRAFT_743178 [Crucibulum laeve]